MHARQRGVRRFSPPSFIYLVPKTAPDGRASPPAARAQHNEAAVLARHVDAAAHSCMNRIDPAWRRVLPQHRRSVKAVDLREHAMECACVCARVIAG